MAETIKFSDTLKSKINQLKDAYPDKKAAIMPILHLVRDQYRYFPPEVISETARVSGFSQEHLLGVVSFYTMFSEKPVGKYHIMVCKTLSCELRDSAEILNKLKEKYGLVHGQVSKDGLFSLEEVECLAACDRGPALQVNDELYCKMNSEKLFALLDKLQTKKEG